MENEPTQTTQPEKKHRNAPAIILGVTTALGIATAVTFGVLWATKPAETISTTADEPSKVQTEVAQCDAEVKSDDCDCPDFKLPIFNGNVVNGTEGRNYSVDTYDTIEGVASAGGATGTLMILDIRDGEPSLKVDPETFNMIYVNKSGSSVPEGYQANYQTFKIKTSSKIADGVIGSFGQATGYETVLLITQEGKVEYLKLDGADLNNLKTSGAIEDLNDIVYIRRGGSAVGNVGGGIDTFAIDKNGNAYSFWNLLWD